MRRSLPPTLSRRRSWVGVATVVAVLAAATSAQAAPFVYVTNSAGNSLSQYDIGAGGLLAPLAPATVAAEESPTGVAVSPDGQSVYALNFGSGTVSQYDVGSGGAISAKTRLRWPPALPARGSGQPDR